MREAVGVGIGAGLVAIGTGSKARGQERTKKLQDARHEAHEEAKENMANKTEQRTGTGTGGKMARSMASHSLAAGAVLAGGGALWDKVRGTSETKAQGRMDAGAELLNHQQAQPGTMPGRLVSQWAADRGKTFNSPQEAAEAYRNAPENKKINQELLKEASQNYKSNSVGMPSMSWDNDHPETANRFEAMQTRIDGNYEHASSSLPQQMTQSGTIPNQFVRQWADQSGRSFDNDTQRKDAFLQEPGNQLALEHLKGYMAINMKNDQYNHPINFDWAGHPAAFEEARKMLPTGPQQPPLPGV